MISGLANNPDPFSNNLNQANQPNMYGMAVGGMTGMGGPGNGNLNPHASPMVYQASPNYTANAASMNNRSNVCCLVCGKA